jgi:hypothetical protein
MWMDLSAIYGHFVDAAETYPHISVRLVHRPVMTLAR